MPAPGNYTGLEASLYDALWRGEEFDDLGFHLERVRAQGGTVLDVGCGSGRLLVPLAREGIEITGVDNGPEMLALCRKKLRAAKARATLHRQAMEALDLRGRVFDTVMVAGASFQLLADDGTAGEALRRMRGHLAPDGQLLVSLFIPWFELGNDALTGHWRVNRDAARHEDGTRVLCHTATELDRHAQILRLCNRYEVFDAGGRLVDTQLMDMRLRWYYRNEFVRFLEAHGYGDIVTYGDFLDEDAVDGHAVITYRAMGA